MKKSPLKNIKNLIVALDLSDYSRLVVKEAQKLGYEMKVPVTYVHAFEFDYSIHGAKKDLRKTLVDQIKATYDLGDDDNIIIRYGYPAKQVIAAAKKFADPMIMVGHKGFSSIVNFFLGSTAEWLATKSPFPVWVHRGTKVVLPKKVLIPSDLGTQTEHTLNQVDKFSHIFKSELEIYHVAHVPVYMFDYPEWSNIYGEIMSADEFNFKQFQKSHPNLKAVREKGDVVEKVVNRAKNFDLVAVAPRDKSSRFPTLGSVASKVIRSANVPVLICP